MDAYDYLFKFILIGDSAVGKSCILTSLIENKFKKGSSHTIGVEFGSKIINVSGKRVKLQIWDTAGQERYRSVTRSYYRGAAGALIVYDITNRDTYHHLINWLADARTLARADISIIAVGNKSDLKDKRAVTFLEASRCAQENEILFLETSALTGEGVEEVFVKVAKMILNKIEDGMQHIEEGLGYHGLFSGLIDPATMMSGVHAGARSLLNEASPAEPASRCISC
ncbi:unnamed protein product [Vitrella brassicaformis CCMP3155]|uniref:Ras-related protein Rab-4B n=1 Tax=Vitrella brassicaformis (strain CCMP3155) TaxID=1169540 RepID=A0A0G4F5X3_VITBC|nr:unnamed protein product [Vitrella brassicaformis CCMP3155]|eukprot:CEM07894.1 unnamed protein product [Vitrella brassicaformis CCMP3155]